MRRRHCALLRRWVVLPSSLSAAGPVGRDGPQPIRVLVVGAGRPRTTHSSSSSINSSHQFFQQHQQQQQRRSIFIPPEGGHGEVGVSQPKKNNNNGGGSTDDPSKSGSSSLSIVAKNNKKKKTKPQNNNTNSSTLLGSTEASSTSTQQQSQQKAIPVQSASPPPLPHDNQKKRVVVIKEEAASKSNPHPRAAKEKNTATTTTTAATTTNSASATGLAAVPKRRFLPLDREITDSSGKTIWVPSMRLVKDDTRPISPTQPLQGIAATTTKTKKKTLPQIYAMAWLDPTVYCREGGQSLAGTDAARKLLRGKRDLMELLGHAVYNPTKFISSSLGPTTTSTTTTATGTTDGITNLESSSTTTTNYNQHQQQQQQQSRNLSFVLHGHGIPPQMLQHIVDFAASLLTQLIASQVSFKQFNVSQHYNSVAASDAVRDIEWVQVRHAETGENQAVPWPPSLNNNNQVQEEQHHWRDDLQLYWTAMNRIATRLGLAVLSKKPRDIANNESSLQSDAPNNNSNASNVSNPFSTVTSCLSLPIAASNYSLLKTPPHHWKVNFSRQRHFSPHQLPGLQSVPALVMEWVPLEGVAAPGHVCIRLQGLSSSAAYCSDNDSNIEPMTVSLSFDASFRTSLQTTYGKA